MINVFGGEDIHDSPNLATCSFNDGLGPSWQSRRWPESRGGGLWGGSVVLQRTTRPAARRRGTRGELSKKQRYNGPLRVGLLSRFCVFHQLGLFGWRRRRCCETMFEGWGGFCGLGQLLLDLDNRKGTLGRRNILAVSFESQAIPSEDNLRSKQGGLHRFRVVLQNNQQPWGALCLYVTWEVE